MTKNDRILWLAGWGSGYAKGLWAGRMVGLYDLIILGAGIAIGITIVRIF